jgi:hypothetical protein
MRRGFHNLYRFYHSFTGYLDGEVDPPEKLTECSEPESVEEVPVDEFEGDVLVISSCSNDKANIEEGVLRPAEDVYNGRLFNSVRELCDATGWDHRVISAKYGLVAPEDEISVYDETLESKEEGIRLQSEIIPELAAILQDYDNVLVIAGEKYRKSIEPLYDSRFHVLNSTGYIDLWMKVRDAVPSTTSTELSQYQ